MKLLNFIKEYALTLRAYERYKRRYRLASLQMKNRLLPHDIRRAIIYLPEWSWYGDLRAGWEKVDLPKIWYTKVYPELTQGSKAVQRHLHLREQWSQEFLTFLNHHACNQHDLLFFYIDTSFLSPEFLDTVKARFAPTCVLMSLDDKNSWEGPRGCEAYSCYRPLASKIDLYWTSARECLAWIAAEGGNPMYLPEGANEGVYHPVSVDAQDIDVCFIGSAYGFRKDWIRRLRKRGLNIRCFGSGWGPDSYLPQELLPAIFCRAKVVLGHGGIGYSERLTNVKARDFEVPMTGGGVYILPFQADLALHFQHGREVLFYRNDEECEFQIRWVLAHPEEARLIAQRARERSLGMHTWTHRFQTVLQVLRGQLQPAEAWQNCTAWTNDPKYISVDRLRTPLNAYEQTH